MTDASCQSSPRPDRSRDRADVTGAPVTRRANAFSLFEIVLVLGIIAVAAAVAAPRYAGALSRYRVESAARRMKADLDATRSRALASSASMTVDFDVALDEYRIFDGVLIANAATTTTIGLGRPPYEATIVSVNFPTKAGVVFDGFGVPDEAGSVVLSAGGYYAVVTITAGSGTVSVSDLQNAMPILPLPPLPQPPQVL